jgi:hypothetical protein
MLPAWASTAPANRPAKMPPSRTYPRERFLSERSVSAVNFWKLLLQPVEIPASGPGGAASLVVTHELEINIPAVSTIALPFRSCGDRFHCGRVAAMVWV